jgi:hypothetical protein
MQQRSSDPGRLQTTLLNMMGCEGNSEVPNDRRSICLVKVVSRIVDSNRFERHFSLTMQDAAWMGNEVHRESYDENNRVRCGGEHAVITVSF